MFEFAAILNSESEKNNGKIMQHFMNDVKRQLPYLTVMTGIQNSKPLDEIIPNSDIIGDWDPLVTGAGKEIGAIGRRTITLKVGLAGPFLVDPETYRSTYLETIESLGVSPKNFPYEAWLPGYLASLTAESLYEVPWRGEYTRPMTTSRHLCDGFFPIIEDEITATNISAANGNYLDLTTGYTTSNIITKLKAQWALFPDATKQSGKIIAHIPEVYKEMYRTNMMTLYPNRYNSAGDVPIDFLDGTDGKLKLQFMYELNPQGAEAAKVVMTTKDNLVLGMSDMGTGVEYKWNFFAPTNYVAKGSAKVALATQLRSIDKRVFNVAKKTA